MSASETREGTSWHVGTLARGTSSGGKLASWHVGEGNTIEGISGQGDTERGRRPRGDTVTRGEAK